MEFPIPNYRNRKNRVGTYSSLQLQRGERERIVVDRDSSRATCTLTTASSNLHLEVPPLTRNKRRGTVKGGKPS